MTLAQWKRKGNTEAWMAVFRNGKALVAAGIMKKHGYEQSIIDRVCFIVGNHHTPGKIDGTDFQILWEADLIENMQVMEDIIKNAGVLKQFVSDNFKTESGKKLAFHRYAGA
jgi:urease accessory protein UreE